MGRRNGETEPHTPKSDLRECEADERPKAPWFAQRRFPSREGVPNVNLGFGEKLEAPIPKGGRQRRGESIQAPRRIAETTDGVWQKNEEGNRMLRIGPSLASVDPKEFVAGTVLRFLARARSKFFRLAASFGSSRARKEQRRIGNGFARITSLGDERGVAASGCVRTSCLICRSR